jgi:2-methylfumaryl-CoA hydratase
MDKTRPGYFFEDFRLGFEIRHAAPRTVTEGDMALFAALTGNRFALTNSAEFAAACGITPRPVDDLLVFNLVSGQSASDILARAVADLGYEEGRFGVPVHPGDTLGAISRVIGLAESADRLTGTVQVRTRGYNQQGETVLDFVRTAMVKTRGQPAEASAAGTAETAPFVPPDRLVLDGLNFSHYDPVLSGSPHFWEDYAPGERIDHGDGVTIGEAEPLLAARLWQKGARRQASGGHVISLARALSMNGLANAVKIAAINRGRTLAPCFPGDTLYAWSRIERKWEFPNRPDIGAIRITTFAAKDHPCADFPGDAGAHPQLALEFDHTALMPRR